MTRETNFDYKGLWHPKPKALYKMTRKELLKELRMFRNAWQKYTGIHQDLDNIRLQGESDQQLRGLLKFYYTQEAKNIAKNKILQRERTLISRIKKMLKF